MNRCVECEKHVVFGRTILGMFVCFECYPRKERPYSGINKDTRIKEKYYY